MFPAAYFNPRYWAARFWPKVGSGDAYGSVSLADATSGAASMTDAASGGVALTDAAVGSVAYVEAPA